MRSWTANATVETNVKISGAGIETSSSVYDVEQIACPARGPSNRANSSRTRFTSKRRSTAELAVATSSRDGALIHGEPGVSGWNRQPVLDENEFSMISASSCLARPLLYAIATRTTRSKEDEDMKRTGTLAIILGGTLLAGVANAAVPASEDIQAPRTESQDIQAPRNYSEDIQAPRTASEDIQSPRASNEDLQAPRIQQHDRRQDVQAPRG